MKRSCFSAVTAAAVMSLLTLITSSSSALQPPRPGELTTLAQTGQLQQAQQDAAALGNHLPHPALGSTLLQQMHTESQAIWPSLPLAPALRSTGNRKVLVMLVDFPQSQRVPWQTKGEVEQRMFDPNYGSAFPSVRKFYRQSSRNQLDIDGVVVDWYEAQHERSYYEALGIGAGNDALITELFNHAVSQGINLAQFDTDSDGVLDAFFVKYAGPAGRWADFWWAYKNDVGSSVPTFQGLQLRSYVWSYYAIQGQGNAEFSPNEYFPSIDIHETGHLLGLPDYYDYDAHGGTTSVGPHGGVGGFDVMDFMLIDHNAVSKFMLGWVTPTVVSEAGSLNHTFYPSSTHDDAVLIMPKVNAVAAETNEFYMVEYRKHGAGNDVIPENPSMFGSGLAIWHVDATRDASGNFRFNNSSTPRKFLRLMEADGLEQIEASNEVLSYDPGDMYSPGKTFTTSSLPSSAAYGNTPTGVSVTNLGSPGASIFATLSLPQVHTATANYNSAGGVISPSIRGAVNGQATSFSVLPKGGYSLRSISGCNGTLSGDTYTTGAMTEDCVITAFFAEPHRVFLVGAASRKVHGSAGTFDLPIDPAGSMTAGQPITVEGRAPDAAGRHYVVVTFDASVTTFHASVGGTTVGLESFQGNSFTFKLEGVLDATRIKLRIANINNHVDNVIEVPVGFLWGDTDSSRGVTAQDITYVRSRSGQVTDSQNFRADLNVSGGITAQDITIVRARSGTPLP